MEEKQQEKKPSKIWTLKFWSAFVIIPLVVIGILGGAAFGFIKAAEDENLKIGSAFKNKYEIQIHVDWNASDEDIYYVADYFEDQLKNMGLYDSEIRILDDDDLMILFPIDSIMNNQEDAFSLVTEEDFQKELFYVEASLLNMSYIEFRTLDGELLFDYDSNNEVTFIEPQPPDTGGETGGGTVPSAAYNNVDPASNQVYGTYDIRLIDHADVKYANGTPYVDLYPEQAYISEFHDAVNYLSDPANQASNPTGTTYTVWFGYDLLNAAIEQTDPEGYSAVENDLYTYIHTDATGNTTEDAIQIAQPFFVTEGNVSRTQSNYDDSFGIYGDFSVNEANAIANQINFANNSFELSVDHQGLKFETLNFKTLKWLFIIFSLLIILIVFLFVWWFGLLGLVSATSSVIVGVLLALPLVFLGVPLSFMTLGILIFNLFISFYSQYLILDLYKNKTLNKNTSSWKKTKQNLFAYNKLIFTPAFFVFVPVAIATFFLSILIQFYVYYFILSFILIIISGYILLIPLMFLMDLIFNFSFRDPKEDKKWNFIIGVKSKIGEDERIFNDLNALNNLASKKSFKVSMIVLSILTVLSFGLLGAYQFTGSNGVNKMITDGSYYSYYVEKDVYSSRYDVGNNPEDENDRYNQNELINEANRNQDEIIQSFEDNGIKIKSTELTRFEYYDINNVTPPDGSEEVNYDYDFSYGFTLYSKDQITSQNYDDIVNELNTIDDHSELLLYDFNGDVISDGYDFSYQIINASSLTNYEELGYAQSLYNYNYKQGFNENTLGVFILFAFLFIFLLIFFRWAVALAILATTILESTTMFFLMLIFFVPFTFAFWYVFIAAIIASTLSKIFITKYLNPEEKKDVYFDQNKSKIVFYGWTIIFAINVLFIGFLGMSVIISLLYSFIFPAVLLFVNVFVYPFIAKPLIRIRNDYNQKRLEKDEENSKSKDLISEEYIKGINK